MLGYVLLVLTTWVGKRVHETLHGKVFGHIMLLEPMEQVYTRSVGHYITMAGDNTFRSGTIVSSLLQAAVGLFYRTGRHGRIVPVFFAGVRWRRAVFIGQYDFNLLLAATCGTGEQSCGQSVMGTWHYTCRGAEQPALHPFNAV